MYNRVEVTFKDGLFRAFPKVSKFEEKEDRFCLIFGEHKHAAIIFKSNINFIELMYIEEED